MQDRIESIMSFLRPLPAGFAALQALVDSRDQASIAALDAALAADLELATSLGKVIVETDGNDLFRSLQNVVGGSLIDFVDRVQDSCDNLRHARRDHRLSYHVGRCPETKVPTLGVQARRDGLVLKTFDVKCPFPTLAAAWFWYACGDGETRIVELPPGWRKVHSAVEPVSAAA